MSRWPRERLVFGAMLMAGIICVATASLTTWSRWPHSINRGDIPAASTPPSQFQPPQRQPKQHPPHANQTPTTKAPPQLRVDLGSLRPVSLSIPSLGVTAPVVPVSVDTGGALGVPTDPHQLGWWAAGPPPGAPQGTAVIDGHVDNAATGPGALFDLRKLPVGAKIIVNEVGGPIEFRLAALREYAKTGFPWQQAFDQQVEGRLVLVTCGGGFDYDTHHYHDNVVAYAIPVNGY